MTISLKLIVSCDILGLEDSFQGTDFGLAFSTACQYALTNEKVCKGFKYVFVKTTQSDIYKCINWSKKLRKGKQEWNKACANLNILFKKNILVKNKVIVKKLIFLVIIVFVKILLQCTYWSFVVFFAGLPTKTLFFKRFYSLRML